MWEKPTPARFWCKCPFQIVTKLDSRKGSRILWFAWTIFTYWNVSPFKEPTATIMLSISKMATSVMPARIAAMVMPACNVGQLFGHWRQSGLPREALRPGWQDPHNRDDWFKGTLHGRIRRWGSGGSGEHPSGISRLDHTGTGKIFSLQWL